MIAQILLRGLLVSMTLIPLTALSQTSSPQWAAAPERCHTGLPTPCPSDKIVFQTAKECICIDPTDTKTATAVYGAAISD